MGDPFKKLTVLVRLSLFLKSQKLPACSGVGNASLVVSTAVVSWTRALPAVELQLFVSYVTENVFPVGPLGSGRTLTNVGRFALAGLLSGGSFGAIEISALARNPISATGVLVV
jgi:hypothetical protein